jgi:sec-independent protein translocase protein TatA
MPGVPELLVILAIVFLIFGASRLPQLARSLGKARTEFQAGVKEGGKESDEDAPTTTTTTPAAPAAPAAKASEDEKTSDGAQS